MSESKENKRSPLIAAIYRGKKKADTYLYTIAAPDNKSMDDVPKELLDRLGQLEEVMRLPLNENRQLANADIKKVIAALNNQGYYLQLPPLELPSSKGGE